MEDYTVKVRIGKKLKSYLVSNYGSEVIEPENGSTLVNMMIPYLELKPKNEEDETDGPDMEECVLIRLPNKRDEKRYSASKRKLYYCNTLWRSVLSEKGQNKVKNFFERNFRHAFFSFMDGYVEGQYENKEEDRRIKVKQGVCSFLNQYHIDYDEKMISTMKRSWHRHTENNEKSDFSPAIY